MTQNTAPMRLLILDTAENAAEQVVSLLAKNQVLNTSERIEEKGRLFEALLSKQWDILLLNEDAQEVNASECVDFIRNNDIDTASVVLLRQEFDVRQLSEATSKGIAGFASLNQPEYSLSMLENVMKNMRERRNQTLEPDAGEAIAYIHDGMHVFANASYIKLFQYTDLDEVLATPFMDMVAEECRKELKQSLRTCQKSGETPDKEHEAARMEIVGLDANKGAFPANLCLKPTYYEGENCLQVLISTKQKQAAVISRMVVKNNRQEVADTVTRELPSPESVAAALANNSLALMYQSVMSASAMEPEFYDIHPQMRGADQTICTAEQIATVVGNSAVGQQLDRWIGAQALRVLGDLHQQGSTQRFQFTITAQTIRDASFSEWLAAQLAEFGVEANALVLNIREVDVLSCIAEATSLITSLHEIGNRVCISGYTNREEIAAIVAACKVSLVRFDHDIREANSRNMLPLSDLKNLVASLQKEGVKVIASNVQDKDTFDCLWLAEVDFVEGAWFQSEPRQLHAKSFRAEPPILGMTG
jgi:EAL domain-containing protein (putative c-di-GMP-specific phosphodiesterase class I)